MISYIRGPLAEKRADAVVIEAGGVGYKVNVPTSVLSELPPLGEEVKLHTHFSVSDAGLSLYGFLSAADLEMFDRLIAVNGIGPKSAIGILSALKPDELRMAVITKDAKMIARAPGIGNKTAQRIILDLADKVSAEDILQAGAGSGRGQPAAGAAGFNEAGREAVEALTALGYSAGEAAQAVRKVEIKDGMGAEDILKGALRQLAFV